MELASGFSIADLYPSIGMLEVISGMKSKIEKLHQERDRIFGDIIDEHKERRQKTKTGQKEADEEDLIDVFLRLQEDGDLEFPLTNNNNKAVIWKEFGSPRRISSLFHEMETETETEFRDMCMVSFASRNGCSLHSRTTTQRSFHLNSSLPVAGVGGSTAPASP
ncbi:hypothetical protein LWI28_008205 [Acer negundo]|uniref:Uncharacterized protein n=1 Tax=Acer negundo TaxID=4023 RepID=A0AAD5NW58_ACENE|nr:hypothetical protein LWI28_008205 [Acer negundo]